MPIIYVFLFMAYANNEILRIFSIKEKKVRTESRRIKIKEQKDAKTE